MVTIQGKLVDSHSRCVHWHSVLDIIALKFKCCQEYYACYTCHDELASHQPEKFDLELDKDISVVLCGNCLCEMTFDEYSTHFDEQGRLCCTHCKALFNPKCKLHYHLYFQTTYPK